MIVLERSAAIPLPPDETWEALYGSGFQNAVRLSDSVVEVRDYRMRDNGTPEYVMVNKSGPMKISHRSSYLVWEPPHRAIEESSETPVPSKLYIEHTAVDGGTRVVQRVEAEPRGIRGFFFRLMRPIAAKTFQADLDTVVERLKAESE